jgi:hypothetical protein
MRSKAEEIKQYREFIASLERGGYLHAMFAGSEAMVEQEIRNDFSYDPLPNLREAQDIAMKERDKMQAECKSLTAKKTQLEKDILLLSREASRTREDLDSLQRQARRLAGL